MLYTNSCCWRYDHNQDRGLIITQAEKWPTDGYFWCNGYSHTVAQSAGDQAAAFFWSSRVKLTNRILIWHHL
jgi:hypothetical protein